MTISLERLRPGLGTATPDLPTGLGGTREQPREIKHRLGEPDLSAAPKEPARSAEPTEPHSPPHPEEQKQQNLAGGALILTGIIVVAANLRLGVSSTGPLLDQLRDRLHLGGAVVTLLPTLWVVIFAFAGPAGSALARRHGAGSVLAASLAVLVAGSAVRGIPDLPGLLAGSVLAGTGIALGNVLLPVVVRTYFPDRVGAVTGIYSTMIALGSTVAAGIAVPLSATLGGPSGGLEFWTVPAVGALILWTASRSHRRDRDIRAAHPAHGPGQPHIPLAAAARSKLAWAMALAFGLQSMAGYVVMGWLPTVLHESGMSPTGAGTVLSVMFAVNAPLSFVVPLTAAKLRSQRPLALALGAVFALGFVALMVAPVTLAYVAAVLIGIGMAAFPLVLTMIGLRGGTPNGTAALSAFSQSAGVPHRRVRPHRVRHRGPRPALLDRPAGPHGGRGAGPGGGRGLGGVARARRVRPGRSFTGPAN